MTGMKLKAAGLKKKNKIQRSNHLFHDAEHIE